MLHCTCAEHKICVNDECRGSACTIEEFFRECKFANRILSKFTFFDTNLILFTAGLGSKVLKVKKGCAMSIPDGLVDNAEIKKTTVTLPDGISVKIDVRIWYCNDKDYCNNKG